MLIERLIIQNEKFSARKDKFHQCIRSAHLYNAMAFIQLQVQVGDTRRVFSMAQPNLSAELYDARKKRSPSPDL